MIDKSNTIDSLYFANQIFPGPVQGKTMGPARVPLAIVRKLQIINVFPCADLSYFPGRSIFLAIVYD